MSGGPVSVDELRRAWRAVQAGEFARPTATRTRAGGGGSVWVRAERVLPVVGAVPGSGASTLGLALASACPGLSRVVEAADGVAYGLVAASTAELGEVDGWVRGWRDTVLIDRAGPHHVPDAPPPLPPQPVRLSVLDAGSDGLRLARGTGWAATALAQARWVVLTTHATVPGLRRVETVLGAALPPERVVVAVLGPPQRRWPRPARQALGVLTRGVADAGRLVTVPHDPGLHVRGVDATPLPASLLRAAATVLDLTGGTGPELTEGTDH